MNEKTKRILFIIGTSLFVISFCFLEGWMFIECIDAFFRGTTGGIRFFGDQTPHYGIKGVKTVLEGWGVRMIIWYPAIMLFQIIYSFIILKEKYHSLKNDKDEKKSEKAFSTIIYIWLAILAVIILISSYCNFLLYILFNPKISILLSILILAEVSALIYLIITEFIIVVAIITGIVFVFAISIDNWALMIIYLLCYFFVFTLAFVIADKVKKRRELKTEN